MLRYLLPILLFATPAHAADTLFVKCYDPDRAYVGHFRFDEPTLVATMLTPEGQSFDMDMQFSEESGRGIFAGGDEITLILDATQAQMTLVRDNEMVTAFCELTQEIF